MAPRRRTTGTTGSAACRPGRSGRCPGVDRRRLDVLAARERTVATEIGVGRTNAQIAARHHLSLAAVKSHLSAILTKLDLNNRVQVALLLRGAGPVPSQ
ncbi:response regulator transcription factor [Plantactinospora siamensis]|uniref:Response regulator transcription factor n=1 Tax=Plantactinospora siamensis TaxID=555372 RepID=A0ABV6P5B3_9ACTN